MAAIVGEKAFRQYLWTYWTILDNYVRGEPSRAAAYIRGLVKTPLKTREPGGKGWCGYSPTRRGVWLQPGEGSRLAKNIYERAGVNEPVTADGVRSMFRADARRGIPARMERFLSPDSPKNQFYQAWATQKVFVEDGTPVPSLRVRLLMEKKRGLEMPQGGVPFLGPLFVGADSELAGIFWFALGEVLGGVPVRPTFLAPLKLEPEAAKDGKGDDGTDAVEVPDGWMARLRELELRDAPASLVLKMVAAAQRSNLHSCPAELVRRCYENWYDPGPQPARREEATLALDRLEEDGWVRRNSGNVYSQYIDLPKDVGWRVLVRLHPDVQSALLDKIHLGYPDTWFFDRWMQWIARHATELPRKIPLRVLPGGRMLYLKHPDRRIGAMRAVAAISSTRGRYIPLWANVLIDDGDASTGLALLQRYAKRRKAVAPSVWCDILRASTILGQHDTALDALRQLSDEVLSASTRDDEDTLKLIGWSLLHIGLGEPAAQTLGLALQTFGRMEAVESVSRLGTVVRERLDDEDIVRPRLAEGVLERRDIDENARASLVAQITPSVT